MLVIKDYQARLAEVFCMLDEMNAVSNPNDRQRRFNVTIQDVAHWAGLSQEITRDELNRFVSSRKIEIFESSMIVTNINDMKRIVDTKTNR